MIHLISQTLGNNKYFHAANCEHVYIEIKNTVHVWITSQQSKIQGGNDVVVVKRYFPTVQQGGRESSTQWETLFSV